MGLAYKITGNVFATYNFGKVTPIIRVPLTDFTTTTTSIYNSGIMNIIITPEYANHYSFTFVSSDTTIATIDASTGFIEGKANGNVNITVTDIVSGITKIFPIAVAIPTPIADLTARINFTVNEGIFLTDIIPEQGDWFRAKVAAFVARGTAFFGSRQLSNADDDSIIFERDNTGLNYYSMRGKMYGTRYTSSQAMAINTRYVVDIKPTGITSDPSVGTFSSSTYNYNQAYALAIGGLQLANGTYTYRQGGMDVFGIEIYSSSNILKHRLIPQSDNTFLDEITNKSYSATGGYVTYADD